MKSSCNIYPEKKKMHGMETFLGKTLHSSPLIFKWLVFSKIWGEEMFRLFTTLHHSSPLTSKRLRVYTLHNSKKAVTAD